MQLEELNDLGVASGVIYRFNVFLEVGRVRKFQNAEFGVLYI